MTEAARPVTFDVSLSAPYSRFGGIDKIVQTAALAERLGYFGVAMGEHLVKPSGRGRDPDESLFYDFHVLAAYVAASTHTIRLISAVSIVPARHPLVQAKLWATLDQVSSGRAIFGAGSGSPQDHAALGASYAFAKRGAVAEEYLEAMRALWTQERATFEGRHVRFEDVESEPKCVQQPHVPIWIAGSGSEASLARVARLADGWLTNEGEPQRLRKRIARAKDAAREHGRNPARIVFGIGLGIGPESRAARARTKARTSFYKYFPREPADTPAKAADLLRAYVAEGVNHFSLRFHWETAAELADRLEWFAGKVAPRV